MNLPEELREQFRRHGAAGGRARAAKLTPDERRAVGHRGATARWVRKRFGAPTFEGLGLPGGAMVDAGLADLASAKATPASLLISLAAPRLRREGVPVPRVERDAEDRLFKLLTRTAGDLAHARYTAHLREMSSFADACRALRFERKRRAS